MMRLLSTLLLTCALAACVTPLTHYQLSALNRGMSSAEVLARVQIEPLVRVPVAVDGRAFVFDRYFLNNGMTSDTYFLMYERDQLVFWGYINEFRRHPNTVYGRAVDVAVLTPVPRKIP